MVIPADILTAESLSHWRNPVYSSVRCENLRVNPQFVLRVKGESSPRVHVALGRYSQTLSAIQCSLYSWCTDSISFVLESITSFTSEHVVREDVKCINFRVPDVR